VPLLVGEVVRGKALASVVEAAKVVDTNGEVVDFEDDEEDTEVSEAVETVEVEAAEETEEA
jgi:trigger factor